MAATDFSAWKKIRKLINDLHLWMGIGSGIILFIVCLTGTIYAFRTEIEQVIEPDKYRVEVQGERMAAAELITELEQQSGGKIDMISIPHAPDAPYKLRIKRPDEEGRGTTYFVNPYTAEIKGTTDSPSSDFFMTVFRLHRWLLMERSVGRVVVGIATVIFVFIIISGMVLWWPKKLKHLKQSLTVKTSANWKRINHDLHNSLGFYASILLMVMALSGLCWSFEWYRDGLGAVLGTKVFGSRGSSEALVSTVSENAVPVSITEVLNKSQEILPYDGDYTIYLPKESSDLITLRKYRPASFSGLKAYDMLLLDQYSGKLLFTDIYAERPLNEKISTMIKPIHTGEIFGTFSKILYFIASLIGTSLPITGVFIWINKLKKKRKKKQRKTVSAA